MNHIELHTEAYKALEGFIASGLVGLLQKAKDRLTVTGMRVDWVQTKEDAEFIRRHMLLHRLV